MTKFLPDPLFSTIIENTPHKAFNLVKEWIIVHQNELEKDWELAQKFEPLEKIPGADND